MTGWLPRPPEELFGAGATASQAYELLTVEVPAERWTGALTTARDELGCTYFDWLSAVDEPDAGLAVCAHLAALGTPVRRLLLRTTVPHGAPELSTATGVYAGAAWHERETHEMFGVVFTGHPGLTPLLLPDGFEGHPLRKDFVLAARVAKAWPGAKEPGESGTGGPKRRQTLPPGVPDPNEWGPLKGQLPPGPARPARRRAAAAADPAGGAGGSGAPGERRPRRARSASAGSASQRAAAETAGTAAGEQAAEEGAAPAERPARPPRRAAAEPGRRSTDAPWLKPPAGTAVPDETASGKTSDETSDEAARRVRETDGRAGAPLAEGGGASVANAPGSTGEAGTGSETGTGGTKKEAGTDTDPDTGRDGTTGDGT
ncbi:NADH-quinone oxidoreductase subunit C [Streptomyces carminius]|uniref:NADH-quinone oxidoreductase subunit C n=1 Tax=Streptomyces carminius TaxID=2665496 RepID=UPI0011B36741|nr:NADH-quinone oxidoreductase subunit C [Streptomyces carminius]